LNSNDIFGYGGEVYSADYALYFYGVDAGFFEEEVEKFV
jgi:hypothetical protein